MSDLVTVTIDGRTVQVPKGTLLVEAAKRLGIDIPVFCYHPKLDPAGVCRMCLVQVEKMPKPVTACTTVVGDGMVVHTRNQTVDSLRQGVLEFLLINHPLDCPVCDKGGECPLQDQTFAYGPSASRLADAKVRKNKASDLGQFIVLDQERCIICRRCTRFDNEVACEQTLVVEERGHNNVITTRAGEPYDSYFSGNTIELCPVGALTSDLYRFKARPWDLSKVDSVCNGCSVGCNVRLDYRHGRLLRVISRENPALDDGWLCDRGRFNYQYVHARERLTQPLIKRDGTFVPATWAEALKLIASRLKATKAEHGAKAIGLIGGGRLTNEEAYLFQKLGRVVLGTGNIDHRVAAQHVASSASFPGRLTDLGDADTILLVEVLPGEQAPVADLRIRRALERRGANVIALGAAMPEYRARYTRLLALPGQTATVLQEGAAEKPQDPRAQELARALAGAKKVAVLWGGDDPGVGKALLALLGGLKKNASAAGEKRAVHLLVAGAQANSRGAEAMGVLPGYLPGYRPLSDRTAREVAEKAWRLKGLPEGGMGTPAMLRAATDGRLQALYLAGANLAQTYPDGKLARAALARVPFLVVNELFLTETAEYAHVVLPAAPFAAKSGHYTALDGTVQEVEAAMAPGVEAQPDALIFDFIAQALQGGTGLVKSNKELEWELNHLAGELAGAPDALVADPGAALPPAAAGQGDLLLVPVARLYAGGGTARFDPSFHPGLERAAYLSPRDAERLGIADGTPVTLAAAGESVHLTARISKLVASGTVQAVGGLHDAPVNRLVAGGAVAVRAGALEEVR